MSDKRVSLLIEGLRAADTVSEVRDAGGRVARIDRHSSYPGAKHVYLDPPPSDAAIRSQWGLPAASTRPDFYPPDLPFVSAIPCHVIEGQDRIMATWRDDACSADMESIRSSIPPELSELVASVKASSAEGPERASKFVAGLKVLSKDWSRADLEEWLVGDSGEVEIEDRFVEAFRAALSQTTEAGRVEEPTDQVPRFAVQSAKLRRDHRQRQLILAASFGISSLTLTERPVDANRPKVV